MTFKLAARQNWILSFDRSSFILQLKYFWFYLQFVKQCSVLFLIICWFVTTVWLWIRLSIWFSICCCCCCFSSVGRVVVVQAVVVVDDGREGVLALLADPVHGLQDVSSDLWKEVQPFEADLCNQSLRVSSNLNTKVCFDVFFQRLFKSFSKSVLNLLANINLKFCNKCL